MRKAAQACSSARATSCSVLPCCSLLCKAGAAERAGAHGAAARSGLQWAAACCHLLFPPAAMPCVLLVRACRTSCGRAWGGTSRRCCRRRSPTPSRCDAACKAVISYIRMECMLALCSVEPSSLVCCMWQIPAPSFVGTAVPPLGAPDWLAVPLPAGPAQCQEDEVAAIRHTQHMPPAVH